jgi:methanethiol S-methyltransferase
MGVTDAGRVTSHPTGTAARVYSAFAYLAFAVSATWAIAFLADLRTVRVIDRAPSGPAWVAVLVDLGLLLVFALQHFVMARAAVKRRMARVVPAAIERSTYVLSTSLCLGLLF